MGFFEALVRVVQACKAGGELPEVFETCADYSRHALFVKVGIVNCVAGR